MGMFDYVNVEIPCPKCGAYLRTFQSKDAGCNMDRVEPENVQRFYVSCHVCKTWVEYARDELPTVPPRPQPSTLAQVQAMGFRQILPEPAEDDRALPIVEAGKP